MQSTIKEIIEILIIPPGINFLLIALGLIAATRCKKTARFIIAFSILLLLFFCTPYTASVLSRPLETYSPFTVSAPSSRGAKAIVVLAAGGKYSAEYDTDTPTEDSLLRIRYAAFIHKKTKLPILISGGDVDPTGPSMASIMDNVLRKDYGIKAKWLEGHSSNTAENAQFSSVLLKKHKIRKVILVTSAYHMRRSVWSFQQTGITVVPAATDYTHGKRDKLRVVDFIPNAHALLINAKIMHEYIGLIWYKLQRL